MERLHPLAIAAALLATHEVIVELQALRLGAHVYLTKPIEAAALTEEVTRLLTAH